MIRKLRHRRLSMLRLAAVALAFQGFCGISFAAGKDDFFKGKTVRIVVGYAPGGSNDAYPRLLAPHLASQLGATVVVENKPGGGGLNALVSLLQEPGDGLRILLLNSEGAVLSQLAEQSGTQFDLRKLSYLGRLSVEVRTLVALKNTPYERLDGFLNSPRSVFFGATGRIDAMGDPASIFCFSLKIACKLVLGYQGAAQAALSVERGEIDAVVNSATQSARLIARGRHAAVAVLSPDRTSLLPNVPSIFELKNLAADEGKWLRFRSRISDFGRSLVVQGNTPADRTAVLASAVAKVLNDPAVQAEAARIDLPITYAPPAEVHQILEGILSGINAEDRALMKRVLLEAY